MHTMDIIAGKWSSVSPSVALMRFFGVSIVAWIFLLPCSRAAVQTVMTNGPVSNSINVVLLSEGYQSAELPQFLVDATNAMSQLLSIEPYYEYSNYFNAFATPTASVNSGTSWFNPGDTYFQSYRPDPFGYISFVTITPTGQSRADQLMRTNVPRHAFGIMLINDTVVDGGSGGTNLALTTPVQLRPFIVNHEVGHTMANLGDEIATDNFEYAATDEPNTSQVTNRNQVKWKAWIATNTPIPTPEAEGYENVVGVFRGAHYSTNWFRPKLSCKMGTGIDSDSIGFCEVCREALVLSFYRKVRPVDSFLPATNRITLTNTNSQTFTLALKQPRSHQLSVQWFTNNTLVAGASNASLTLLPASLGNGTNLVKAVVRDPAVVDGNAWVLTDTSNLLSQTLTWTTKVDIVSLKLEQPRWVGSNKFSFRLTGRAPQGYSISATTNFTNWSLLSTGVMPGAGFVNFTNNTGSTNYKWRHFRARTPP